MPVEVAAKQIPADPKTCLITLVQPGLSDSVIKVYPAEHEAEKIWLDNARGIERWEAVERLLQNHAERGTRVPKPARWHSDPKQTLSPDLKPENIPLVKLDGAALKAPPVEERFLLPTQNAPNVLDLDKKVADLTSLVGSLATAISNLTTSVQHPVKPPRRGRPPKRKEA